MLNPFYMYIQYFRTSRMWHKVNMLNGGLNLSFFFSLTGYHTKVKELSLPYYFLIAGGRIFESIAFARILTLYEMQTTSSTIWTRVAISISNEISAQTNE